MKTNLFHISIALLIVFVGFFSTRITSAATIILDESVYAGSQTKTFTFYANAGDAVTIDATCLISTDADPYITGVYDPNGGFLGSVDDSGSMVCSFNGRNAVFSFTAATTGIYSVSVLNIGGNGTASGILRTSVSGTTVAPVTGTASSLPECLFGDGRINDRQCAAPVVLYCNPDHGVDVYVRDPGLGKFVFSFRLGEGETGGKGNVLITKDASGLFVVSTTYDTGKPYLFAWDGCPVTETHIIAY